MFVSLPRDKTVVPGNVFKAALLCLEVSNNSSRHLNELLHFKLASSLNFVVKMTASIFFLFHSPTVTQLWNLQCRAPTEQWELYDIFSLDLFRLKNKMSWFSPLSRNCFILWEWHQSRRLFSELHSTSFLFSWFSAKLLCYSLFSVFQPVFKSGLHAFSRNLGCLFHHKLLLF